MIHAVGDSHTQIFLDDPRVQRMPDLACTAYQLINSPLSRLHAGEAIVEYITENLHQGDILLISAGEIDCRIHIYKAHMKTGRSILNLVSETVDRLSIFVNELGKAFPGLNFAVLGIPPPGWEGNIYRYEHYATPKQHVRIYRYFYSTYITYPWNARYVDMYRAFVGPDGHVKPGWLREDKVHLIPAAKEEALRQINEKRERWEGWMP